MSDESRNNGESTRRQMPEGVRFAPGNPGRPKGSRNKLGEAFLEALHDDFQTNGKAAIEACRMEKPDQYVKVIASLLPKQVEIKEGAFDGIDDVELAALVAAARSALGVVEVGGEGDGGAAGSQPAGGLPPLH